MESPDGRGMLEVKMTFAESVSLPLKELRRVSNIQEMNVQ
jgi:hypothetical protein